MATTIQNRRSHCAALLSLAAICTASLLAGDSTPNITVRYSATPVESGRAGRILLRVAVAVENPNDREVVARLRFSDAARPSRAESTPAFTIHAHGAARHFRELEITREELQFWRTLSPPVAIELRDDSGVWQGAAVPFLNVPVEEAAQ